LRTRVRCRIVNLIRGRCLIAVSNSERTKAALAAAKRRGVKLGGYRGTIMTKAMRKAASEVITKRVKARAADLAPTIADLRAAGATSLRAIAAGLTERGHSYCARYWDLVSDAGYAGVGAVLINFPPLFGAGLREFDRPNRRNRTLSVV
jgi:hypothetical protein